MELTHNTLFFCSVSQGIATPAASCLVPVADMYNMAARREDVNVMCNTNKDSTHFECYTTTAIPAGRQVRAAAINQC